MGKLRQYGEDQKKEIQYPERIDLYKSYIYIGLVLFSPRIRLIYVVIQLGIPRILGLMYELVCL